MQIENKGNNTDKTFLTILADGKFHQEVEVGTEGAITRTYEDKEGVEQSKTELVHDSVKGIITAVEFHDGVFGKNLNITIDNDGIISMGTASNFGEDMMKKLPAIDFTKEVTITPYAFIPKGEENSKKGVTVYQGGVKVQSHYSKEFPVDSKKYVTINGMPEVEGDTKSFDSDDWKMHFMVVRKFLIKEIEKLSIFKKAEVKVEDKTEINFPSSEEVGF